MSKKKGIMYKDEMEKDLVMILATSSLAIERAHNSDLRMQGKLEIDEISVEPEEGIQVFPAGQEDGLQRRYLFVNYEGERDEYGDDFDTGETPENILKALKHHRKVWDKASDKVEDKLREMGYKKISDDGYQKDNWFLRFTHLPEKIEDIDYWRRHDYGLVDWKQKERKKIMDLAKKKSEGEEDG